MGTIQRAKTLKKDVKTLNIGFFHPSCVGGGGGERVLWTAVNSLLDEWPKAKVYIYAKKNTSQVILDSVKQQFGFDLEGKSVQFVWLNHTEWLEAKRYPRFTLIGQTLGSIVTILEALSSFVPDVFVETVGYAAANPIAVWYGCIVISYVHYPTISTDMLSKVQNRLADFNNSSAIAKSPILSKLKLIYYTLFAYIYGWMGRCADQVMVNSTWTQNHIVSLWQTTTSVVYPPTDTTVLSKFPLVPRKNQIASVAQFRPEKNQMMQLEILHKLLPRYPDLKLVMLGGARNDADMQLVDRLEQKCRDLSIADSVQFDVNAPYDELLSLLESSLIGLHTMKDEHFGISIIEYMSAGCIPVCHDSGGPKMDIINQAKTGFRAKKVQDYVDCIDKIMKMSPENRQALQGSARNIATHDFSAQVFSKAFLDNLRNPFLISK